MSRTREERAFIMKYKGFSVMRIMEIDCDSFGWMYKVKSKYFTFCNDGDEKKPSKYYAVEESSVDKCKEVIDKFVKDDTSCFTHEEIKKYVNDPNSKCQCAYGYDSLMRLMRQHQKADRRLKLLLEERLTDANFHSACSYLADGDYKGFEKFVADDCRFNEKFELYTHTMRKRIKEPKKLVDGLNKVIADYLKANGINDTNVSVIYVDKW